MMERLYTIASSLTTQILLWVVGCSVGIFAVVYLCMHYNQLPSFSMTAAIISLLLLLVACRIVVAHHLRPLKLLANSAKRIAEGHLDERVPDSGHKDEIGQLQNSFVVMQRSLSDYISDMQQKRDALSEQNVMLQAAYEQAQEADKLKERFVSNMTDQMTRTVGSLTMQTETLCNEFRHLSRAELAKIQIQILNDTDTVILLLDKMLNASQTDHPHYDGSNPTIQSIL